MDNLDLQHRIDEALANTPPPAWDDRAACERAVVARRRQTRRRWSAATSLASAAAVGAVFLSAQGGWSPSAPDRVPSAEATTHTTVNSLSLASAVASAAKADKGGKTVTVALLTRVEEHLRKHMPALEDCRVDRFVAQPMGPESVAMQITCAGKKLNVLVADRFGGVGPERDYRTAVGVPDDSGWDGFLAEAIKGTEQVFGETGPGDVG